MCICVLCFVGERRRSKPLTNSTSRKSLQRYALFHSPHVPTMIVFDDLPSIRGVHVFTVDWLVLRACWPLPQRENEVNECSPCCPPACFRFQIKAEREEKAALGTDMPYNRQIP